MLVTKTTITVTYISVVANTFRLQHSPPTFVTNIDVAIVMTNASESDDQTTVVIQIELCMMIGQSVQIYLDQNNIESGPKVQ